MKETKKYRDKNSKTSRLEKVEELKLNHNYEVSLFSTTPAGAD
jgi:hypothetical protein